MTEYVLMFLVLLIAAIAFYVVYSRYIQPPPKPHSAIYVEALRDLLDGKPESAFTKLRQVVAEDSSNLDAYLRLGKILREHGKPDRALQVHKDLTLRGGLDRTQKAAILRQLVADYTDMGELDTAQAALKELISIDPNSRWAYRELLGLQEKAQNWDEAYDTAAQMLKLESSKSKRPLARFKYQQGMDLLDKREYHKARILFKEALGLNPEFAPAYLAIGDSYNEEERYEDAVNFWNKLIDAVPAEGYRVIDRLKKTLFDLGRFGDIADICENILKHSPRDLVARLTLAEFYEKKGDLDLAEELLLQVIEDEPDKPRPIQELVRIYIEKKDYKKIEELYGNLARKREKRQGTRHDGVVDTTLIGER